MQVCYIGIHVPWWFAAPIDPSSKCPPLTRTPYRPWCVLLPTLCPCVLTVQLPFISENMWCLVFCSCVGLLRIKTSSSIHVPAKDMISFFLWLCSIPWCIRTTFSLFSLSLMGTEVDSMSLLLQIVLQ